MTNSWTSFANAIRDGVRELVTPAQYLIIDGAAHAKVRGMSSEDVLARTTELAVSCCSAAANSLPDMDAAREARALLFEVRRRDLQLSDVPEHGLKQLRKLADKHGAPAKMAMPSRSEGVIGF